MSHFIVTAVTRHLSTTARELPESFKFLLWPNWKKKEKRKRKQKEKKKNKNNQTKPFPQGKPKPGETIQGMGQTSVNWKETSFGNYAIDFSCWENKSWGPHLYDKYCYETTIPICLSLKETNKKLNKQGNRKKCVLWMELHSLKSQLALPRTFLSSFV